MQMRPRYISIFKVAKVKKNRSDHHGEDSQQTAEYFTPSTNSKPASEAVNKLWKSTWSARYGH